MQLNHTLYTTEEARELLGLSDTAIVRSYISAGYLEAIKAGGQWLIKKNSLQDKLNRQAKINSYR